jgi:nitric oxide reductase activation protein
MSAVGRDRDVPAYAQSFVRALWGIEVSVGALPAAPSELAPRRASFAGSRLWLPASPLAEVPGSFSNYLLAAAAHASAHLRFGAARFLVKTLKPAQIAIISLLEDARVERLAVRQYPGLARLWAPFHRARPSGAKTSTALLARLARALHDDAYVDDDAWVNKGRELFLAAHADWHDVNQSRRIGNALGNDLGQMRVQFNAQDYVVQPAYRDDNVGLWQFEQDSAQDGTELETEGVRRLDDDGVLPDQKRWQHAAREAGSARERPAREPAQGLRLETSPTPEPAIFYGEWDYIILRERPRFCALHERPAQPGDASRFDAALARYAPARRRLERSALRLVGRRPAPGRRLTAGDRLDLPAAIASVVARASSARPDPRVYRSVRFQLEPPALLLLIDLSESLNGTPAGASTTVLELARSASGLLASTLAGVAIDLAIHGFSSNGRHDVGYYRFKDFDQPYDDGARACLAGMRANLSTRLGCALRHAGQVLGARAARRKLLLVVTDGELSDVDVHDSKYLLFDAKHATLRNRQQGVTSFCVGLDASAEASVRRVFGPGKYLLLDRLDELPQKLSQVYLRLST